MRETILNKLQTAEHSLTAIFAELRSVISDEAVARAAVAIADGVVEAFRVGRAWREELVEDHDAIRVRFVVRSYRALTSKFASFAMAHGPVLDDLLNHPHVTDLTVLISTFVPPRTSDGDSKFEVTLNVMPHPRAGAAAQLAHLGPFLMPQMLIDEERVRLRSVLKGQVVYQEI